MIDSGWFVAITGFAQATPWLHGPVVAFTEYGVVLLALAALVILWHLRREGSETLARALWVPAAVVVAYAVDSGIKQLVAEPRPCQAIPSAATVLPCDAPGDYSFPSNHTVIFAAFTAAVFLLNRRWGVLAAVVTLLMAATRLYVGAHYVHDVLAGLAVGVLVGSAGSLLVKPVAGLLDRIRERPQWTQAARK
ncbi:phosphatase PAP2 family protein [Amycolatopsis sp. H20-H5]|uniref:phosphatase PAP2 family protein n=1 Tax=Amycolatopsis sp. H20-H5 TaxID=3046309 RepID=UPI002DB9C928|nr:phosphatase PAP2 family protein [Amycolatopsis sp. H20-H5]MEC3978506.1 phosphatase PAP2 family protein [Amycolatopsis sp. H20-H5]